MTFTGYVTIAIILYSLWSSISRDFQKGLALAFGLMVALPSYMSISLPGALPELTIHRLILFLVLIYYLKDSSNNDMFQNIPLLPSISILIFTQLLSTLESISFTLSIKNFISLNIETVLFYIIVSNTAISKDMSFKLLKAGCFGLVAVAIIACLEKYAHTNMSHLITGVHFSVDPSRPTTILSTYSHRIALGYAMAIGFALQFYVALQTKKSLNRILAWGNVILICAVCYFSDSRGAWMGMLISVVFIGLFNRSSTRKALAILGVIVAVVLITRPGIRQAITNKYQATVSEDSVQGYSYQYRWLLWEVAWNEINRSPVRLLIGYGGLSTEVMDLSHYFERGVGGTTAKLGYTSWDNQFAADMVEFGLIGFVVELIVYINALWLLVKGWRHAKGPDQDFYSIIIASVIVYLFAMTNVYMFSDQIRFLFWVILALGCKYPALNDDRLGKFKIWLAIRLATSPHRLKHIN